MAGIRIHSDLCKSCKLCVGACPRNLIEMDGGVINSKGFNPAAPVPDMAEKCTGCTFCAIICPDCAIEVDR
jgi:2-oxoglutarate ferredoxin oxidoreductase subunit delta